MKFILPTGASICLMMVLTACAIGSEPINPPANTAFTAATPMIEATAAIQAATEPIPT